MGQRDNVTPAAVSATSLLRAALLGASALLPVWLVAANPASAQAPNAAPSGGAVIAGQARIAQSGTATIIQQSSQRAAINWQSFDVGSQQSVQFVQPNAAAATLNRVIGPDPSLIAGRISANGTVVLVNQSGVMFTQGAQVNAQALAVSAADIATQAFMAGGPLHFDRPGKPGAMVVNQGTITVGQAGLAALAAPGVANSGVITATLGRVVLAGATRYTLDLYGDGLLAIDVTGQVRQVPQGPNGAPVAALVTNTGTILAQGGSVTLSAAAADGLIKTLVAAGGRIATDNPGGAGGALVLEAIGGSISIEGALSATGQSGGQAQAVASDRVAMQAGSRIDVSGTAQGGTVALGTTLARAAGGPSVTGQRTARNVSVATGASIDASAADMGRGGRVVALSTGTTTMAGRVAVRGGPSGGDGGFVEISGGVLRLAGVVDATAPAGATGQLLLDPTDLWVSDVQPSVATNSANTTGTIHVGDAPDISWISPTTLAGFAADISLAASRNIFFANSGNPSATTNILSLGTFSLAAIAGASLTIDRGFSIKTSGPVYLRAGNGITLDGSAGVTGGLVSSLTGPSVVSARLVVLSVGVGNVITVGTAASDVAIISASSSAATGGLVALVGPVATGILEVAPSHAGDTMVLSGTTILDATVSPGTVDVVLFDATSSGSGTLRIGDTQTLSLVGSIDVARATDLFGSALDLRTSGAVTESTGTLLGVGTLSGAAGSVALSGAQNSIGTLAAFATTGNFALTDAASLLVSGAVTAGGTLLSGNTGALTLTVTGTGNTLAIGNATTTGSLLASKITLSAPGNIDSLAGQGTITANVLRATSSAGAVTLTDAANSIGTLDTASAGGDFSLTNNASLLVLGAMTAGGTSLTGNTGALTLTVTGTGNTLAVGNATTTGSLLASKITLSAPGNIDALAGQGTITANVLRATSSAGAVTLTDAANSLGTLDTASAGGDFSLTNNASLLVLGEVTAGGTSLTGNTGALTLTVTGTGNTLAIGNDTTTGSLLAAKITLSAPGGISALANQGTITANVLRATSSVGAVTLTGAANSIGTLDTASAGGDFSLTDNASLLVLGEVTAGGTSLTGNTGALTLTVTGTGNTLAIGNATTTGSLLASKITLSAPGNIDALANQGTITANVLRATSSAGAVTLTDAANSLGTLDTASAGGDFSLTNNASLLVLGEVTAGGTSLTGNTGALTLTVTGTGNTLAVGNATTTGSLLASKITLSAPGNIDALAGQGTITANVLRATSSAGAVTLTDAANSIGTLDTASAGGDFSLTDSASLRVSGAVTSGSTTGGVTIKVTSGDLIVDNAQVAVSGPGGAGGRATLSAAAGNVTIQGATSEIFAPAAGSIAITAGPTGTITITDGVIGSGSVVLNAGSVLQSGGTIASARGITLTQVSGATQTGGTMVTAAGTTLTVAGGTLSIGGSVIAPRIAGPWTWVDGGTLITAMDLTFASLSMSSGEIATFGTITVGSGSGGAGVAGSAASAGSHFSQTGGVIAAVGNIALWSADTASFGGSMATAGRLGATVAGDVSQTGGLISGHQGVSLLSTGGNAVQSGGIVAAGTGSGVGVLVQAPAGSNDFGTFQIAGTPTVAMVDVSVSCPACTVPQVLPLAAADVTLSPASQIGFPDPTEMAPYGSTAARVDVTLLGRTISIDKAITAGTLALYSEVNTTQENTGTIDAYVLTGSAGVVANSGGTIVLASGITGLGWSAASLGWTSPTAGTVTLDGVNHVLQLADYVSTGGTLAMTDVLDNLTVPPPQTLTVSGVVGDCNGNVTLNVTGGVDIAGKLAAAGNVDVTASGTITVAASSAVLATGTASLNAPAAAIVVASKGTVAANAGVVLNAASVRIDGFVGTQGSGDVALPIGAPVTLSGTLSTGRLDDVSGSQVTVWPAGWNLNDGELFVLNSSLSIGLASFGGVIGVGGDLTLTGAVLTQTGGTLAAGGNLTVQGGLNQNSWGWIAAGGDVTIGSGSGTAGHAGSTASVGTISLDGTILAGGNVALWSTGLISLGGVIEAGGQVGATATDSIYLFQTLSGVGGVWLLANNGDLTVRSTAVLAGTVGGTDDTNGIVLQAPRGSVDFAGNAIEIAIAPTVRIGLQGAVDCNCDAGTLNATSGIQPFGIFRTSIPQAQTPYASLTAYPTTDTRVNVALLGQSIKLEGVLTAGTLGLYSLTTTTQSADALDAFKLTGSAGVTADSNGTIMLARGITDLRWSAASLGWTSPSAGGVTLGFANHVLQLADYVSTGGTLAMTDVLDNATAPALQALTVSGIVGDCNGSVALTVTGGVDVAGTLVAGSSLAASGNVDVSASGTITVEASSAVLATGALSLNGPAATIPAAAILVASGGTVAANGNVTLDATAINIDGVVATRASLISTGDTVANTGTILAGGDLALTRAALTQTGGTLAAGGNLSVAGGLTQTAGLIAAGGNVTLGNGSGTAGHAGSTASVGRIAQNGTILAGGAVALWSTGRISLGGVIAAGGQVGATAGAVGAGSVSDTSVAATSIDVSGTVSGVGGVWLLTNSGDLTVRSSAVLAGAVGGTDDAHGIVLQAPHGSVDFASNAIALAGALTGNIDLQGSADCNCDAGTLNAISSIQFASTLTPSAPAAQTPYASLTAYPTTDTRVNVALVGQSIKLEGVLTAGTLGLYALTTTTQSAGTLDAFWLTGSAGVTADPNGSLRLPLGLTGLGWSAAGATALGWTSPSAGGVTLGAANHVLQLADYVSTGGTLAMTDVLDNATAPALQTLTVSGIVGDCNGSVALTVTGGVDVAGTLAASGNVDVTASGTIAVEASAAVLATGTLSLNGPAAAIVVASGGTVAADGNVTLDATAIEIDGVVATLGALATPTATPVLGQNAVLLVRSGDATVQLSSFAGLIEVGGNLSVVTPAGALTQIAGTLAAGGGVSINGGLSQSSSATIVAGKAVTIGLGSGTAGSPASTGSTGSIVQDGIILAGADVALWSAGSIALAGQVEAGGTVRATAGAGIDITGTLSGVGGLRLLARAGDLTVHGGAVLAGGAGGTGDLVLQAPGNTVELASTSANGIAIAAAPSIAIGLAGSVDCNCTSGTLTAASGVVPITTFTPARLAPQPAGLASGARVNMTLVGQAITLSEIVNAGTIGLYSAGDTTESSTGRIEALVVTGSAGLAADAQGSIALASRLTGLGWSTTSLGWTNPTAGSATLGTAADPVTVRAAETISNANTIGTLLDYGATRDFSLTDAVALNVAAKSTVQAGGTLALASAGGLRIDGALSNTGGLTLLVANENLLNSGTAVSATPVSVTLNGSVTAPSGALSVWSEGNLAAPGVVNVGTLTGQVGAASDAAQGPTNFAANLISTASLTGANTIGAIGQLLVTGDLTLTTGGTLAVLGSVSAGASKTMTLTAPTLSVADGAQLTAAGGTIDLLSPTLSVGAATLTAARLVLSTDQASGSILVADGATLDARAAATATALIDPGQAGVRQPVDSSSASSGGIYVAIGAKGGFQAANGSGQIQLGAITIGGPLLRLALPDSAGAGASTGSIQIGGLTTLGASQNSAVALWLGNGRATGTLSGETLAVFASARTAVAELSGSVANARGQVFPAGSQAAASAGGQGQLQPATGQVIYNPSAKLQLNGCPISSINCRIVNLVQLPPLVALPALPPLLSAPLDDFDLLLPGVPDRED